MFSIPFNPSAHLACQYGRHASAVGHDADFPTADDLPADASTDALNRRVPEAAVPTDPLIYRFHELVSVYGTTFKALIHEEYGDGIMSAIDFDMDMSRLPHEKGDRVKIIMSGKYLQYKTY